jgi:hypothetical protein
MIHDTPFVHFSLIHMYKNPFTVEPLYCERLDFVFMHLRMLIHTVYTCVQYILVVLYLTKRRRQTDERLESVSLHR